MKVKINQIIDEEATLINRRQTNLFVGDTSQGPVAELIEDTSPKSVTDFLKEIMNDDNDVIFDQSKKQDYYSKPMEIEVVIALTLSPDQVNELLALENILKDQDNLIDQMQEILNGTDYNKSTIRAMIDKLARRYF